MMEVNVLRPRGVQVSRLLPLHRNSRYWLVGSVELLSVAVLPRLTVVRTLCCCGEIRAIRHASEGPVNSV